MYSMAAPAHKNDLDWSLNDDIGLAPTSSFFDGKTPRRRESQGSVASFGTVRSIRSVRAASVSHHRDSHKRNSGTVSHSEQPHRRSHSTEFLRDGSSSTIASQVSALGAGPRDPADRLPPTTSILRKTSFLTEKPQAAAATSPLHGDAGRRPGATPGPAISRKTSFAPMAQVVAPATAGPGEVQSTVPARRSLSAMPRPILKVAGVVSGATADRWQRATKRLSLVGRVARRSDGGTRAAATAGMSAGAGGDTVFQKRRLSAPHRMNSQKLVTDAGSGDRLFNRALAAAVQVGQASSPATQSSDQCQLRTPFTGRASVTATALFPTTATSAGASRCSSSNDSSSSPSPTCGIDADTQTWVQALVHGGHNSSQELLTDAIPPICRRLSARSVDDDVSLIALDSAKASHQPHRQSVSAVPEIQVVAASLIKKFLRWSGRNVLSCCFLAAAPLNPPVFHVLSTAANTWLGVTQALCARESAAQH